MAIIARHPTRRPQCGMAPATRTMPRAARSPESSPGGSSRSCPRRCTTAKGRHPRGRGKARSGGRARLTLARTLPASRRRPSGSPRRTSEPSLGKSARRDSDEPRHTSRYTFMAPTFLYTAKCATVGFISPSRDSPEQAKQATGPWCLTLPSLGGASSSFSASSRSLRKPQSMRALERDFPGLLPLLTPPWPGMLDV